MNKQKILIVSSTFYPANSPRSFRTTELVKEFARQGHQVTLITPKNDEQQFAFEREYGIKIKNLGSRHLNRFDTSNDGSFMTLIKRVLNRGLNLFFEFPDIQWMWKVKQALKEESGYDIMISIAAPHPVHWGVALARNSKHRIADTWIADCGDPFMGTVLDTFRKLFYFKYFEKAFCRKAEFITVPLEKAKSAYYPEFRDKIRIIPQGFNFDEVDVSHNTHCSNGIPTFAYAGSLIPGGRDPGEFLNYLVNLDREFRFILYTKSKNLVEPWIGKDEDRIEVRDYITRKELLKELSTMDFLVNFENSTSQQMPSKLIDYYLTGRPVLSVPSKEIDLEAVREFLSGDYSKRVKFSDMDRYRIENVCNRFIELAKSDKHE